MARPKNKTELLKLSQENFDRLLAQVEKIADDLKLQPGVNDDWSVKDVLAHLHAWHMLMLTWYQEGMTGTKPPMPAPGYTWKQTPELNRVIYLEYREEDYPDVVRSLKESHQQVMDLIRRHSQEELFTKQLYSWTGSTSMGSYLTSATSSHYAWAWDLIRKWIKALPQKGNI